MFKRGVIVIILLVLLLVVIDSSWIFSYKRTITSNVIGDGEKVYTIFQEFDNSILLDTSNGADNESTFMKINNLQKDINMSFAIETRVTNLSSSCLNYDSDCRVVVTQNLVNGTKKILSDTDHYYINEKTNLTLYKNIDNVLEHKIFCIENSCPQRINSTIVLTEIK